MKKFFFKKKAKIDSVIFFNHVINKNWSAWSKRISIKENEKEEVYYFSLLLKKMIKVGKKNKLINNIFI